MRTVIKILIVIIVLLILALLTTRKTGVANMFEVTSKSLKDGSTLSLRQVYKGYGCMGENISPDLSWSGAPDNTKSYAIVCHDPDAPTTTGWYHWLVLNIPASKTAIESGEKLSAPIVETLTDFGSFGYGGACPPMGHGVHHYIFTVYALDVPGIEVDKNAKPKEVENLIKKHSLATAQITATYQR